MTHNNGVSNQFEELRQSFSNQLPGNIKEIVNLWQLYQNSNDNDVFDRLLQAVHKLASTSLSMGYMRIGISAQVIETTLKEMKNKEYAGDDRLVVNYQTITERLNLIQQALRKDKLENMINPGAPIVSLQETRSERLIYLLEDDMLQAKEISRQIGYFGYSVRIFDNISEIEEAVLDEKPAAILLDTVFPEGDADEDNATGVLWKKLPPKIAVIFISTSDDIQIRLKAARAGGKAYFSKPVNIGMLVDVLDRLMAVEDVLPYRILIVDDDTVQANVTSLHLKRVGMDTSIINDPFTIIQALHDFNPDLILLDMYMPYCSGMELAVVIRQIESFVSIPIVFLSAETDREKQLEAVGLGGDDFLTKPIKPEHLISSVSSRVDRYRQLRYLMMRDSLTGLLNHTTFKERFSQEFSRTARQNKPLSYIMIDLDDFKKVNDVYGHTAGDRVIKSLASMLSKRLRSSDVIGRYGGEEFAVVLPNTNSADAVCIFDDLRSSFEQIYHRAMDGEFNVTFSGGVASFPEFTSSSELAEAADKALYRAKKAGKNQIVCAEL
jgi:diguanylate cyclase (GGDEF)-like protein